MQRDAPPARVWLWRAPAGPLTECKSPFHGCLFKRRGRSPRRSAAGPLARLARRPVHSRSRETGAHSVWASHAWRLVLLRSLGQSRPISTNLGQSRLLSATSCNSYSSASDVARITSKYAPAVCSSAALGERPCSKPSKGTGPGVGSIACGEEWYTPPAAGAVGSVQSTCSKPTRKSALVRSPTPLSVDHSKYAVTNQERGGPVSRTDGRSAEGQQRRRDVPRLLVAHQQHLERVVGRQARCFTCSQPRGRGASPAHSRRCESALLTPAASVGEELRQHKAGGACAK